MKMLKMLADHEGCKNGDQVGFQSDAEADALVADGKAVELALGPKGWAEPKPAAEA